MCPPRRLPGRSQGRHQLPDPDSLRTLFFWGFEFDERLEDRILLWKRSLTPPAEALKVSFQNWNKSEFATYLETLAESPECNGRELSEPATRQAISGRAQPGPSLAASWSGLFRSFLSGEAVTQEATHIHTGLLRLGLALEESREYWRQVTPEANNSEVTQRAFEERWFGAKSASRVSYIVNGLAARFQAFPQAFISLKTWDPVEIQDRRWVCHWHLQLSDPLYRNFSHDYLTQRLRHPEPTVEKLSALEWLRALAPDRWNGATSERLASGLTSSACEAGFCSGTVSPRPISVPRVSNHALGYLLYALREIQFEGTLLATLTWNRPS